MIHVVGSPLFDNKMFRPIGPSLVVRFCTRNEEGPIGAKYLVAKQRTLYHVDYG